MKKLRDDPDVPKTSWTLVWGLMIDPDDMLTKEQLEEFMSKSFGIREKIRRGADTHYGPLNQGLDSLSSPRYR